ncbi:MAG: hypothetical protein AB7U20_05960 [Planctomycetaceae bacterium]
MSRSTWRWTGIALCSLVIAGPVEAGKPRQPQDAAVFGTFIGSTPCDGVRSLLDIPKTDLHLQWQLTLLTDPQTQKPASYQFRGHYHTPVPGGRPSDTQDHLVEKSGRWSITKGTPARADAVVYELEGLPALCVITQDVLHLLHEDRTLMLGGGGWSYSLSREEAAEEPGNRLLALAATGNDSYRLSPLATGPSVFGIFNGRTPYNGINRVLGRPENPAGLKAKWRLTLLQDPDTQAPTTYQLDGTFYRGNPRKGVWTIEQGTASDPAAVVYHLHAAGGERPMLLLKGDDNVLFMLDQSWTPLVGHADFSYTLNRRPDEEKIAAEASK